MNSRWKLPGFQERILRLTTCGQIPMGQGWKMTAKAAESRQNGALPVVHGNSCAYDPDGNVLSKVNEKKMGHVSISGILTGPAYGCNFVPCHVEPHAPALRRSVARGCPFGDDRWQNAMAGELGLEWTLRPRGRPTKIEHEED